MTPAVKQTGAGPAAEENGPSEPATPKETVFFTLPGGEVSVGIHDLEEIRKALLTRLNGFEHEFRDTFAAELRNGTSAINQAGVPRIGKWFVERRGDHLALVRQSPRTATMIQFLAHLRKADSGWEITSLGEERYYVA